MLASSFALLAVTAMVLAACGKEAPKAPEPRPALTQVVGAVGQSDMLWVGEVRARYETDQGFRIGGKVAKRLGIEEAPREEGIAVHSVALLLRA